MDRTISMQVIICLLREERRTFLQAHQQSSGFRFKVNLANLVAAPHSVVLPREDHVSRTQRTHCPGHGVA